MRQFYRGWAGLTKFEQFVEREIWMQLGWTWLDYLKVGKVLAEDRDANWAERLDFIEPNSSISEAYEASIEASSGVISAPESGKEMDLQIVKQYRVNRLVKIA